MVVVNVKSDSLETLARHVRYILKLLLTYNILCLDIGCQAKGTLSCLNGGTCLSNGFCSCIYGYKGSTCEKC